jgi:hypothetical protein
MAMLAGFRYTSLKDAILSHPTMAEGLNVLFLGVKLASKNAGKADDLTSPMASNRRISAA